MTTAVIDVIGMHVMYVNVSKKVRNKNYSEADGRENARFSRRIERSHYEYNIVQY